MVNTKHKQVIKTKTINGDGFLRDERIMAADGEEDDGASRMDSEGWRIIILHSNAIFRIFNGWMKRD